MTCNSMGNDFMALPSLTDLLYFHEVASELHFSRAAKKLNVTQPSLSIAIQRLENLLGESLFMRHKQGANLTRAGSEFHNHVKQILAQWKNAVADIKVTANSVSGIVNIGCHSILTLFMRKMLSDLFAQYPDLEIHFQHESSTKIMENILQGHCDIGLVTDPDHHPDMIMQEIATTELGFWVSKEHQQKFNLFSSETIFICNPDLPPTQYLISELLNKTKHKQLKQNTMNQLETIVSMTLEGYGVGILPSNYTKKFFGDKLMLMPDAPVYKKPLCLAYRPENRSVKVVQIVLQAIKELAHQEKV